MRDSEAKRFIDFQAFLEGLVRELNLLSAEGWVVLVEGQRDSAALRKLGYRGGLLTGYKFKKTISSVGAGPRRVVVLTDLDREGRRLAGRYAAMMSHEGFEVSMDQRRRLMRASRGVFRHVENLSRFADLLP